MWRRVLGLLVLAGVLWAGGALYGLHWSATAAAAAAPGMTSGHVRIVRAEPTRYGQAVVLEDLERQQFGTVLLRRTLFVFWCNWGGSYGYQLNEREPFRETGYGHGQGPQQFVIGIKADPAIRYIAAGTSTGQQLADTTLTLAQVRAQPERYQVQPVVDGYALFLADEASAFNWTFVAYDEQDEPIAARIRPGSAPAWVKRLVD
ncbi:MAG: hypothetical protein ACM3XM_03440 [Mycobacterium leprae]